MDEQHHTRPTLHALIGAVQGFALWSLHESVDGDFWPAGSAPWIWSLAYFIAMTPLAWQLLPGVFERGAQRLACALLLGLGYALLGAHAGWQNSVPDMRADFSYVFVAVVLAFVLLGLIGGWDAKARRLDYSRHFDAAWRNGLLIPLSIGVTGLVWALLWAGALLMKAIGLHGLGELLEKHLPQYLVTATSVSWVIGTGLARPGTLLALRRFVLTLVSWLLPLALSLALCWVLALPFTGLDTLFATRNAASYAFWFTALAVGLLNAAVQDGRTEPPYTPRLAKALAWVWLSMLPIIAIGDIALARRVSQHGWTPDRVWAAYVGLMLTLYAFGYASSQLRREPWMARVRAANWAVCAVGIIAAVALISPIADSHRISVKSQLDRLESGAVASEKFDWRSISRMGRYGHAALSDIDKQGGAHAARARQALQELQLSAGARRPITASELHQHLLVLPKGREVDAAWLDAVTRDKAWQMNRCRSVELNCLVWIQDLDGDGVDEIVFISGEGPSAEVTLYVRQSGAWQEASRAWAIDPRRGKRSLEDWRKAIEQGRVQPVKPRWPDLQIDGERIELR
ncbi:MAG: DUF4153 domain-containing protein [Paucibacter sp.]|nr:DUF4153 domain-containing protein [Roseateles sp.]